MKTAAQRIAYYTRKASTFSAARFDILRNRPVKQPPATRLNRLLAYKSALKRIQTERGPLC
jgi:hypothetical protein